MSYIFIPPNRVVNVSLPFSSQLGIIHHFVFLFHFGGFSSTTALFKYGAVPTVRTNASFDLFGGLTVTYFLDSPRVLASALLMYQTADKIARCVKYDKLNYKVD